MNKEIIAQRIKGQDGYRFTSLMEVKNQVALEGEKILDFGIGEQRCGAPQEVIDVLKEESTYPFNHIYSDNGIDEFKEKVSEYFNQEYGVYFDPKSEINHCLGIKSALSILPLCFINPGDYVLSSSPGYVVLENMAKWLGANVIHLDLNEDNNYLFDLDEIDEEILRKTKILYMNYPNNPTGQIANVEFYKKIIDCAQKYNFIVVNDAAYIDLTFEQKDKLSFMQVEGAKSVGVELHSFSKGYNMTGFRIGYIIGNKEIIKAFKLVKDNLDSGQFIPIQKAAIKALECQEFIKNNCKKIYNRHKKFYEICNNNNLITNIPKATFYQFVKVPKIVEFNNKIIIIKSGVEFSMFLLRKLKIMTIPYQNNVRFSMTFTLANCNEEDNFFKEFNNRVSKCKFIY